MQQGYAGLTFTFLEIFYMEKETQHQYSYS